MEDACLNSEVVHVKDRDVSRSPSPEKSDCEGNSSVDVSRQQSLDDSRRNSSVDNVDDSKGRSFKKRRRKRARTASERQNWDEGPTAGVSPSRGENVSDSESSGGEDGVKSAKNDSDSFKSPESMAKPTRVAHHCCSEDFWSS